MLAEISTGLKNELHKVSEFHLKRAKIVTNGSRVTHVQRVYLKVSRLEVNFDRIHASLFEVT